MKTTSLLLLTFIAATGLLPSAHAQSVITLGTAASFGVLGTSTVTNTCATIVNGDLGVSPGGAYTGFPPGVVNGTVFNADATAGLAHADAVTAYNVLAAESPTGQFYFHLAALLGNGTVACWGFNANHECEVTPGKLAGMSAMKQVAAGGFHTAALSLAGQVSAWGLNDRGQTVVPSAAPPVVPTGAGIVNKNPYQ